MKNSLSKVVLVTMMATVPLMAGNYSYNTHSLFAIEGGATNIDVERAGATGGFDITKTNLPNIGLKLGAEGENFRAFLGGRYYDAKDFDALSTLGGELQYLFNFSKHANFFLGANAGKAFIKIATDGTVPSVSTSSVYYGGDAGFNFHASEMIDLEIGAKYMALDVNEKVGVDTYTIDSMITAYASVIIKWKMD